MTSYGGDSDIITIVTKSTLSSDQYFEAMAAVHANITFVANGYIVNAYNVSNDIGGINFY